MRNISIQSQKALVTNLLHDDSRARLLAKILSDEPKAELYLVGGAVRDALLMRKTKDLDFVVRNVPLKKLQNLLELHGTVHLVGKKFGVLKFIPKGSSEEPVDISLPRTEYSIGNTGHYRDFKIETDYRLPLDVDLSRRDFTINALAFNIHTNELIDPFGGIADLQLRVIRTVGLPSRRFAEDYSRLLRALRFACQLNFSIEEKTFHAIQVHAKKIVKTVTVKISARTSEEVQVVPNEIVAREMIKAFSADPSRACDLYEQSRLFDVLMPEMKKMHGCIQDPLWHSEGDVWTHSRMALDLLTSKKFQKEFGPDRPDATLIFATILHDIGKPYTLQTPEKHGVERIHFYGHDRVGAELVHRIFLRLRSSSVEGMPVDPDTLYWLIKNHLLLLNSDIGSMKNNTLEKYFFQDPHRGETLLKLIFVDSLATVRADGKTSLGNYRRCRKRLALLGARDTLRSLPKPIVSGHDVMRVLRIPPGKRIGEIILSVREEQLAGRVRTKQDALKFLKTYAEKDSRKARRTKTR